MDGIRFRKARPEDAAPLGALHVGSWRETYAGLLPSEELDALSADARAAMWHAILSDPAACGETAVYLAESGDEVIGFGACGAQRDGALAARGYDGEFGAVYVLRSHQGAGVGRRLMRLMAEALRAQDRRGASLWVLRENEAARTFYDRLGGTIIGEKADAQSGSIRTELAYGWRDLEALSG
jgi:ribosomal protein S18 acetylase RimI-like enzyme